MFRRIRIIPYRQASKSAKTLAEELGGKVVRLQNSSYLPRASDFIVNWGNSKHVDYSTDLETPVVNDCMRCELEYAHNKLNFFQTFSGSSPLPPFWTNKEDIPDDQFPIVCRTKLTGHSGAGIVIASDRDNLVNCQLYVKYIPKKEEYRVHLGLRKSGPIYIQRKARRLSCSDPNWQVRNHSNGFVYVQASQDDKNLAAVVEAAQEVFSALRLDFGAVDVIYNEYLERAYVLEINTAPGLEGTTGKKYAEYFRSFYT